MKFQRLKFQRKKFQIPITTGFLEPGAGIWDLFFCYFPFGAAKIGDFGFLTSCAPSFLAKNVPESTPLFLAYKYRLFPYLHRPVLQVIALPAGIAAIGQAKLIPVQGAHHLPQGIYIAVGQ
jgi:hypothetical protein